MKKREFYRNTVLTACAALAPLSAAEADVVTLLKTQPAGNSWNTASYWSDGKAPSAANDYLVENGYMLRTPDNTSAASANTFAGNSLTIRGTNTFVGMKGNAVVSDLILDGGQIKNSKKENAVVTLEGNVLISGTSHAQFISDETTNGAKRQSDSRSLRVGAKISGAADSSLLAESASTGKIWFLNSGNDFAGTLTVGADTDLWLYETAGSTKNAGTLGADQVKLVTSQTAKVYTAEDLTVGTWTASWQSTSGVKTQLMPNAVTVTNAWEQNALRIAGIDAPIGTTVTSTISDRVPNTYFIKAGADVKDSVGWDNISYWVTGSADGEAAQYIPTVGDTIHLTAKIRGFLKKDSGPVEYMLAKVYLDNGGSFLMKNPKNVLCVPDMILNGGALYNGYQDNSATVLDGHIYVQAESSFYAEPERTIELRSVLEDSPSGTANLHVKQDRGSSNAAYKKSTKPTLLLTADNSGYSGSFIMERSTWLKTTADGALGTGGFTMNGEGQVQLGGVQSVKAVAIANSGSTALNTLEISDSLTAETVDITGKSTLVKGTGTLTADRISIFPSAGYTKEGSTADVTFENGFSTGELRLRAANVVVSGGDVVIGSDARDTSLSVPYVDSAYNSELTPQTFYKTALDLSGADSVVIKVKRFEIATIAGGNDVAPQGTVRLAPNSTVIADTLSMASSDNVGLASQVNALYLGSQETTLAVDTMYIAGGKYYSADGSEKTGTKGIALIQAAEGGKLTLTDTAGTGGADLYLGWAPITTGGGSDGTVDLRGVTDDSVMKFGLIDMARKNSQAGHAKAAFSMDAGTVTAEKMVLGTHEGGNGAVTVTVDLEGGTLDVKTIQRGTSTGKETVNFNFTGGTLKTDQWGTETMPMDLVQNGGILTPSGNSLTVYGDYQQNDGLLMLDVGTQTMTVYGGAAMTQLGLDLADGSVFDDSMIYELIRIENAADFHAAALELKLSDSLSGYELSAAVMGDFLVVGNAGLIANTVPEPSAWMLLVLGTAGVGLLRRRTHRKK